MSLLPCHGPTPAGTCEELAGTVASQATSAGFKVKVANLDSVVRAAKGGTDVLPKTGAVVVVSSTYNGTPPDNAAGFSKWLDEQQEGESAAESVTRQHAQPAVGHYQWQRSIMERFPASCAGVVYIP
jgi:sulfite reductase alpha subunit-like flavoprotein